RIPDLLDLALADTVLPQEVTRRIRAIDFEAIMRAGVFIYEPHVMEHRADIEPFRIVLQLLALARHRAEQEPARRMMKEQVRLGVAHELRGVACHLAVRNPDACDDIAH